MQPKFYTAGKVWHAPRFKTIREMGFGVRARWIDLDQDSPIVTERKDLLWQMCFEDVRDSDFLLLYSEDESEEQRGALVELGMAYGMNKPVFAINRSKSLRANDISDVAFTHHHLFTWLTSKTLLQGTLEALSLYKDLQKKEYVA